MSAQTYSNNKLAIETTNGGLEVDFTNPFTLYLFSMVIQEQSTSGGSYTTIVDVGSLLNQFIYTGPWTIPGTTNITPLTLPVPSYSLILNKKYRVSCNIPDHFTYKLFTNNPYSSFKVCIYAATSTGRIVGRRTIAEIPMNMTQYDTYFEYSGNGPSVGETKFTTPVKNGKYGWDLYSPYTDQNDDGIDHTGEADGDVDQFFFGFSFC